MDSVFKKLMVFPKEMAKKTVLSSWKELKGALNRLPSYLFLHIDNYLRIDIYTLIIRSKLYFKH